MAYTYLDLCNRVLRRFNEVEMSSSNFPTVIGFPSQIKDAVNDALNDIYTAELNWPFLYSQEKSQALSAGIVKYALPSNVTQVDWESFVIEPDNTQTPSVDGTKLVFMTYRDYLSKYWPLDSTAINQGLTNSYRMPGLVFPYPDGSNFGVTPVPNIAYKITYDYYYKPTDLSLYSDTIVIPDRYVRVVIDGATYYGYMFRDNVDEASVVLKKFQSGIALMRTELINKEDYMRSDQLNKSNVTVIGFV